MPAAASICPHPVDTRTPRVPENLAYSLTLPAALASPAVARSAARTILEAHGLRDVTAAAVQVIGELAVCACLFTPSDSVYLSLRFRDDALRISLYDGHPRHAHRRLAAACDGRRRSVLLLLACVMHACDGDWGFGESPEPGGGTRLWAVLPHAGARAYGQAA
ncbi:ATP-binding protein [Streptomyces sioyaensis]|uniref:ATP-binding protein n=1 Tax=Streptomyces sioyaensis TaxID=67364 RepID=UPI001F1CDC3D|nr:ATP-binding protein [Streptomyces sioyaensis]MCF3172412.1 ATP-binding protein [Streptomyces sioyaensis]